MDWMRRLAAAIGRPVTFALSQNNADPTSWRRLLELSADAHAEGVPVRPQVHGRTVSLLLGFQTFHPLQFTAEWQRAGLGLLPWHEQVARIESDPDLPDEQAETANPDAPTVDERELVVDESKNNADDFERLLNLDEEWPDAFEERSRPSSASTGWG